MIFGLLWVALLVFFAYRNLKTAYVIYQMYGKMTGQAWLYTGLGVLMSYFVLNSLGIL